MAKNNQETEQLAVNGVSKNSRGSNDNKSRKENDDNEEYDVLDSGKQLEEKFVYHITPSVIIFIFLKVYKAE